MNERNIPRDLKYAAIQYTLDDMKASFAKEEELLNRLKQIQEEYKREIYEFLGSKAKEYSNFYEKRDEVARTMQHQFTATLEGQKIQREFRKKRLAEANEFIKNLGINVNDVKSIRNKYHEEFRLVIEKATKVKERKTPSDVIVDSNSNQEGL
jgi:hypothetical protein